MRSDHNTGGFHPKNLTENRENNTCLDFNDTADDDGLSSVQKSAEITAGHIEMSILVSRLILWSHVVDDHGRIVYDH